MPNYKYRAISNSGAEVSGVVEAYDEFEAVTAIKRTHRVVTFIEQVDKKKFGLNMSVGSRKIKEQTLALMCSQFSIVLKAGMPIVRCLELISTQTSNKELRHLLEQVCEDVSTGYGLAQSFENKGGNMLPTTFIETIRSGEESGSLEISFAKLEVYFDNSARIKKKVKSAMMYPIFLSVMAVVVIAIVLLVAMPVFLDMFAEFGNELPLPTKMLIAMSDFFANYWILLVAVIAALVFAMKLIGKTEKGRMFFARLNLRLPILGHLAQMKGASQLANTLSTMLTSGLTIVNAVAICSKVIDNHYLSTQLSTAAAGIEDGEPLGSCLKKCECFPHLLVEMTAVGEETGTLEDTLQTIGGYYDSETEIASAQALNALQPIITVIMGVVIGFIVIALYLPMFSMYSGMM